MANEEHLAILRQGVKAWNEWRPEHERWKLRRADLSGAVLREADLSRANLSAADLSAADLSTADLSRANLRWANLSAANLSGANLSAADLNAADLRWVSLSAADLSAADLSRANLRWANLSGADLSGANLREADLSGANLREAVLARAIFLRTIVTTVDLRDVIGLDAVEHRGPSVLGIDTIELSQGQIPASFLRGCGVSDRLIEYLPSLITQPIQYYSTFISYSSNDEALAKRLHADLQAAGVRCWYAPEDLKIGESILGGIDQGIRLHEKLLLLLSEASVHSKWVEREVTLALDRELRESRRVLFPVRIDDAVLTSGAAWAALIRADHHIGDFCAWKEHDAYRAVFDRLLRDLRAGSATQ